jgi:transcriptional adapter 2-alpha
MLNIDVNKSGKIFDFLVATGALRLAYDPAARPVPRPNGLASVPPPSGVNGVGGVKTNGALGKDERPGLVEVRVHENGAQY